MVQLRKNEEELAQETNKRKLLFTVIAWYGIMAAQEFVDELALLFPVIAWYGIIGNEKSPCLLCSWGFFM